MPRRARPARKRRAAETTAAAARVFAERGYHGATTQDIADVLGIRQASLYYYFRSKEAALEEVCLDGVGAYVARAAAIMRGPGSAADKLAQLVRHHIAPWRDRADFTRVFLRERHNLPDASRHRVGRYARRYERIFQQVLEAGVAAGEFRRDLDCRIATLGAIGMCNAASAWYGVEPGATLERIAGVFAALLLEGVRTPMMRRTSARSGARRRG
ncbi:MAG: TetR/AcrR family transcriptional regulator [Burkholderiales bacterium]|nr:TetR/AcrR family transcriptional regulator [Burkholderiales bacterium]